MTAELFRAAIANFGPQNDQRPVRVLDFGCGQGALVHELADAGLDAYGCDLDATWATSAAWSRSGPAETWEDQERLKPISKLPYRLPFPDGYFDAVVSDQVLEHAQNTEEAFREIRRVLAPGGVAVHLMPSKWYLPLEPHLYIPFVSWMWPNVPTWWLALWALLGVRNPHQKGLSWRRVVDINRAYCRDGLSYLSRPTLEKISQKVFDHSEWPSKFYVTNATDGVGRMLRKIPGGVFLSGAATRYRQRFLLQRRL